MYSISAAIYPVLNLSYSSSREKEFQVKSSKYSKKSFNLYFKEGRLWKGTDWELSVSSPSQTSIFKLFSFYMWLLLIFNSILGPDVLFIRSFFSFVLLLKNMILRTAETTEFKEPLFSLLSYYSSKILSLLFVLQKQ